MPKVHQKIVQEILEKQKKDKSVIAITLFGSMARDEEKPNSDIDILVVSKKAKKWELLNTKRYGIKIDFEICPLKNLYHQIEKYPFLSYDYLSQKIIYDPEEIIKNIKKELKVYFDKHPEVVHFWEKKLKIMRENKSKGKDSKDAVKSYDEAEILFSDVHKITRNFFRE